MVPTQEVDELELVVAPKPPIVTLQLAEEAPYALLVVLVITFLWAYSWNQLNTFS